MKIQNILREVKDNRKKFGKRYPLHSLLSLILLSRLCGYKGVKSAYYLGRSLHYKQLIKLGFVRHGFPSYEAILESLKKVDVNSLESSLSKIVGLSIESSTEGADHLSMDGKSLCGRKTEAGRAYHLLSLFSNKVEGVYGQIRSNTGGGEISAAIKLISTLDIKGKVITGDAMFSSSRLCKKIIDRGGNYVFTLKSNRQELYHEALQIFRTNPWSEVERVYKEQIDKDHGRIECREIRVMNWPYVHKNNGFNTIKQVAQITRYREVIGSNKKKNITKTYAITGLSESQAGPKKLLQYNREHWAVENNLHRNRDTLFAEDKQTIRVGFAPQANCAISNIALWLIKKNKHKNIFKNMSLEAITQACARKISIPIEMLF